MKRAFLAVVGAVLLPLAISTSLFFGAQHLKAQQAGHTPVPNIPLNDAMGQFWSLKTQDDGAGNQLVAGAMFIQSSDGSTWEPLMLDGNGNLPVSMSPNYVYLGSQYPQAYAGSNTRAVTASQTGTTAATTATLAAAANTTTFICGFSIRADATAAATGNATVTGVVTGTMNFTQWTAPLASGVGLVEEHFNPCVPAQVANSTISVVSAAPGSGGTVSVSAWGYQSPNAP